MRKKLYIIVGMILILYIVIINMISSAKIAFSGQTAALGLLMIIYGFKFREITDFINNKRLLRMIFKGFKRAAAVIICLLIVIEGIIIVYPKHDTTNSDYILVLGAGLKNGYYPSLTLAYRLDAAIEFINEHNNGGKIVVSGGKGSDERLSEAEAMERYLEEKGIPQDRILVENKSSTTSENFEFSKRVIEGDSGRFIEDINVKVVTTTFHAFRSRMLAARHGYNNVTNYCGNAVWYIAPVNYLRESFAVVKSFLFD